jgi:hypothetical protein
VLSACTIIAGNYLPFARVLASSFLTHHPGTSFTVLLIDRGAGAIAEPPTPLPGDERIDWWTLDDLGLDRPELHRLAGIYDVTEFATAVKPLLLQHLLARGHEAVVYLDPDIQIHASIAEVADLAARHGIVLTPHTMQPFPKDGRQVDDRFVLAAGIYNLGFIGVGPSSIKFLKWWWQVTRRDALSDIARHMFTDQRWVDFVPSLFEHVILKDPAYNVAYWNLHARDLTFDGSRYLVDGAPLRFFHFSGFEPRKPDVLSKHQGDRPRIVPSDRPVLARLCGEYASALEQAGMNAGPRPRYAWARTAGDLELTARMRRLYRSAVMAAESGDGTEPPDPFDRSSPDAFLAWLNAPDATESPRVSRYLHSIYRDRLDLQIQFPDLAGADAARLVDWIWRDSDLREQTPIELLPMAHATAVSAPNSTIPTPSSDAVASPIAPLESLLPHLDQMNVLRTGAESGALSGLRLAAQRLLFRILRPVVFQQQQLNAQLIAALRHATVALRREEQLRASLDRRLRDLTRELVDLKREIRKLKSEDR